MAEIPYAEASELGLVPRRIEDALVEYYGLQGRYPSGFPRSAAGTLPFFRVPSPFQRPSALSLRSGLVPPRFGLGPLGLGLGLSPAPGAISGGGAPAGRRAVAQGGPADVATLLSRGEPQDIAQVIRMIEAGLVPPGVVQALVRSGQVPPPAARPAIQAAEAADMSPQQALSLAKRGISVAKEATKFAQGEGLAHDVLVELGIVDPARIGRQTVEAEQAFQLQRAGERVPFAPEPIAGAFAPFALSPEIVSGVSGGAAAPAGFDLATAAPFQISPDILSGASGGGALESAGAGAAGAAGLATVPADVAAGLDIAYGGTGAAPGAGILAGVGQALPYVGAALGIGQTFAGNLPGQQKILDAMAYAAAPFTFGLSALAPSLIHGLGIEKDVLGVMKYADPLTYHATKALGGLFGEPAVPHEVREALETGRHGQQVKGFLGDIRRAQNQADLYNLLAKRASDPAQSIMFRARLPQGTEGVLMPTDPKALARHQAQPEFGAIVAPATGRFEQPRIGQDLFYRLLKEQPDALKAKLQAGISPDKAQPMNRALLGAVQSKAREFEALSQIEPRLAAIRERAGRPELTAQEVLKAAIQAQAQGIPTSSPEFLALLKSLGTAPPPAAAPSPEPPPPEGVAGHSSIGPLQSIHEGGVVPHTGAFTLERGEIVIPREVAQRLIGGANGSVPRQNRMMRTYLDSRPGGGALFEAKSNPDPASHWRLATDAREVREALDEGDPVIAVASEVLRMPAHRALPMIERARVAQYEQPGGGIELLDAMARGAAPAFNQMGGE